MHMYTAIIERCPDTSLYVGYVPNFPGATAKPRRSTSFTATYARLSKCYSKMASRHLRQNSWEPRPW